MRDEAERLAGNTRSTGHRLVASLTQYVFCALLGCVVGVGDAHSQLSPHWSLHTEIGADQYADAVMLFSQVTAAAFVDDTSFVVADAGEPSIRFFTIEGHYLRTAGRRGAGPGEFTLPAFLAVDSIVRVFDPQQHRVVLFDKRGDHLGTRRITATREFNVTRIQPLSARLQIGVTTPLLGPSREDTHFLVFTIDDTSERLDTIASFPAGSTRWSASGGRQGMGLVPTKFGPGGAVGIRDSLVAVADGYRGSVQLFAVVADSLHLVQEWSLDEVSQPITNADRDATKDEWIGFLHQRGAKVDKLVVDTPSRWSVVHRVIVDETGCVWILAAIGGAHSDSRVVISPAHDEERWIVSSPTPSRMSFWLPAGFSLMDVRRGMAVGVQRNQDGLETVRVYRIE